MNISTIEQSWHKGAKFLKESTRDGWWPYQMPQSASLETTAWCGLALRHDKTMRDQVANYLLNSQNPDGGWSTQPNTRTSDWCTALALIALSFLGCPANNRLASFLGTNSKPFKRGIAFLLENRLEIYTPIGKIITYMMKGPKALEYPRGWPWTPGTFHWVEPTSYALVSLKLAPSSYQNTLLKDAIVQANQFLLEHACLGGGWNHGNNICLSVNLPPYPVTTAQAIIALQDLVGNAVVQDGVSYLQRILGKQNSIMSLSWSALALDVVGIDSSEILYRLAQHQTVHGGFGGNLFLDALALCALDLKVHGNVLKFQSQPCSE